MRAVLMAAMATRLLVTGGAGAEAEAKRPEARASWREVGKSFSTLRKEISTLRQDYAQARAGAHDEAQAPRRP